jgi:hypothetical protein
LAKDPDPWAVAGGGSEDAVTGCERCEDAVERMIQRKVAGDDTALSGETVENAIFLPQVGGLIADGSDKSAIPGDPMKYLTRCECDGKIEGPVFQRDALKAFFQRTK